MSPPEKQPLGEAICARLITEIEKLGFGAEHPLTLPHYTEAEFSTARDPYSGDETLIATWRDCAGHAIGTLKFHGDGTFYAEYDVARPHPLDPRWFVEGVAAWGKGEMIKSEAKLLSALQG